MSKYTMMTRRWLVLTVGLAMAIQLAAAGDPLRILPLGDSITQSDSSFPFGPVDDGHRSYRYDLWTRLIDAGLEVDYVGSKFGNYNFETDEDDEEPGLGWPDHKGYVFDRDHEGHWGWSVADVLYGRGPDPNNLSDWLTGYTADVALIHLGTNDATEARDPNTVAAEMKVIIDFLRGDNPNITILLAKILPLVAGVGSVTPAQEQAVIDWNSKIDGIAAEKSTAQSRVIVVDQFSDFNPATETWDGFHPNLTGEGKVGSRWTEAILRAFPPFLPISDDFSDTTLDPNWTFYDPDGDGTLSLNGTQAFLSVPEGTSHDASYDVTTQYNSPRLLQEVPDINFEVEIKFNSSVDAQHETQGILVENDPNNFIVCEIHYFNGKNRLYFAHFQDKTLQPSSVAQDLVIPGTTARYMRLRRDGTFWTASYSYDGISWPQSQQYGRIFPMTPKRTGFFVGNGDTEFTTAVDYFFNIYKPIVPEDGGQYMLDVSASAGGVVLNDPNQTFFNLDDEVILTAVPDPDYEFSGWSGDAVGTSNPLVVNMNNDKTIQANFALVPSKAPISDDFSDTTLDPNWTFYNPDGDGTLVMNGAHAVLSAPAGTNHDASYDINTQYDAPRLMQEMPDVDFEVEIKLNSPVDEQYEAQGILVEQDPDNFVKFNTHFSGGTNRIFFGIYQNQVLQSGFVNQNLTSPSLPARYLRLQRQGNTWTGSYSYDGVSWPSNRSFTKTILLTPNRIGPFVANGGTQFTSAVDYFFNLNYPIVPEDGGNYLLDLTTSSGGVVLKDPNQTHFDLNDVVTLTAIADSSHIFTGWSGDASGLINPLDVTMDDDKIIQAIFDPNQAVTQYSLDVTVSGSGVVLKAPNQATYNEGTVVTLTAVPDPNWLFTNWSGDASGSGNPLDVTVDANKTIQAHFTPAPVFQAGLPISDDFSDTTLDPNWTFYNPDGDTTFMLNGAHAVISLPAGTNHDAGYDGSTQYNAPRLMQEIPDIEFEVEVKFKLPVAESFEGQGLLVEQDPNNFIRLDTYYLNGKHHIFFAHYAGRTLQAGSINVELANPDAPLVYMRLLRQGGVWTGSYSYDGFSWPANQLFNKSFSLTPQRVGFFAGNGGSQFTSMVDYFFNVSDPIVPEDGGNYLLDLTTSSGGVVLKDPNQTFFDLNDVVTLTAIADSSHIFTGWSGDASGLTNPLDVTMDDDKIIQAIFDPNQVVTQYSLDVTVSGSGTVLKNPDQSTYDDGTAVTLTAVPDPNRLFTNWSGDASGSGNPLDVTMDANKTIQAHFTPVPVILSDLPISDDFSDTTLDPNWTFTNPDGDATFTLNGAHAVISLPVGTNHDAGYDGSTQYNAPRLMQEIPNIDFEVEIKFKLPVAESFEGQGLLVEQDPNNFVRLDTYHLNGKYHIFFAHYAGRTLQGGSVNVELEDPNTPLVYLRLLRQGSIWTGSYSYDGVSWPVDQLFNKSFSLTPQRVGFFAGNGGSQFTSAVDYFFNVNDPIVPEDGGNYLLDLATSAGGVVLKDPDQTYFDPNDLVTLTAVPDPNYDFTGWSGDAGGLTNPLDVTMDDDKIIQAAFVSNQLPSQFTLDVTVSGNGVVLKDPDQSTYDGGTVVTLTAVPDPNRLFTSWSGDASGSGNPLDVTMDASKTIQANFTPVPVFSSNFPISDDFSDTTLDPNWTFTNPDGDATFTLNGAHAVISLPAGTNHDVSYDVSTQYNAPRLMQEIPDINFEVEAKFQLPVAEPFEGQGLLAEQDPNNFIRLDTYYLNGKHNLFFAHYANQTLQAGFVNVELTDPNIPLIYLRMLRQGSNWTGSYSYDGLNWPANQLFHKVFSLTPQRVGFFAGNGGSQFTSSVDYFFNVNDPIVPEDGGKYLLDLMVSGSGIVVKDPNQNYFDLDDIVTLTATPGTNYEFTGWSGDASGLTNPLDVTMDDDKAIQATFASTQSGMQYSLNVPVNGSGTALKNPDQPMYDNGTVVMLTATPDPNWLFAGWSGDASGTGNPLDVTVDADKTVQANFTPVPVLPAGSLISDDFSDTTLDPNWTFYNPDGDGVLTLNGAHAVMSLPAGTNHDASYDVSTQYDAPRLMQEIQDIDFEVEIKFENPVAEPFEGQGLLVEQDPNNFIRLDTYYFNGKHNLFFAHYANQTLQGGYVNVELTNPNTPLIYLRLLRQGNVWTGSYSYDGVSWPVDQLFNKSFSLTPQRVGFFAGNGGSQFTSAVDYFFNVNDPIVPEDGGKYLLDLTVSGGGIIAKDPDQILFDPNDMATLTAIPDPNYDFTGWSGDASGLTNPLDVTMDDDKAILATFTPNSSGPPRTLNLVVNGSGTIFKDPNQTVFPNGSVVTLTAVGDPNWVFTGWALDAGGTTNPLQVTMDVDKTIEAEFQPAGSSNIDVWYGSLQRFGHLGNPQQWVNILGSLVNPQNIVSLEYSLNGGAFNSLTIGPGTGIDTRRRAYDEGDFIVEIDYTTLNDGLNTVLLRATDDQSNVEEKTVLVDYAAGNIWPRSTSVDWSAITDLQDAVQVVDGIWTITPDGLRTVQVGYDRVVSFGDLDWDDYEVLVPITVHDVDESIIGMLPSLYPGLGITLRWQGHTDAPIVCTQPHCGWEPLTGTVWFQWDHNGGVGGDQYGGTINYTGLNPLSFDVTYMVRLRVEDQPGQDPEYRLRVWPADQPEPGVWHTTKTIPSTHTRGSVIIVAHHVDVTVGDYVVTSLDETTPPVISGIQATPDDISASITWATNEPADSAVHYGQTLGYELGQVSDSSFVTQHEIVLTNLDPNTTYHFQVISSDEDTNEATSGDMMFTTLPPDLTPPVISNIQYQVGGNWALITFDTDEPADGQVAIGRCLDYSGGVFTEGQLLTSHSFLISGLEGNALYHFQLAATDNNGNEAQTSDQALITSNAFYSESFNGYTVGDDPAGWFDTQANNSLLPNDSLYDVAEINGEKALHTASTLTNIHSHYLADNSSLWADYDYSGRMYVTDDSGIGVTFLSNFVNDPNYYRLRRFNLGGFRDFQISPVGLSITGGTTSSGVIPQIDTWYQFRIQIEDTGSRTEIRANVWEDGTPEPENWQIDCYDDSAGRRTSGAIGVWSMQSGDKYWDNISVTSLYASSLTPPLIAQTGFEPEQGFVDFAPGGDPNLLGSVTDMDGVTWSSIDGARIWNNPALAPEGSQFLVLGWPPASGQGDPNCCSDPNVSLDIEIPGLDDGVGTLQFAVTGYETTTDATILVQYNDNMGSGWVTVWQADIPGLDPNDITAPWPTYTVGVYQLGDVDLRICRQGTGVVLLDQLNVKDMRCPNTAPSFFENPLTKPQAEEDQMYLSTLQGDAVDPNGMGSLSFAKVDGPLWLLIDPNGQLSGTPADPDVGENQFTVQVDDDEGGSGLTTMLIEVLDRLDGDRGYEDFSGLASYWLQSGCGRCGGTDLNGDEQVGAIDLIIMYETWLAEQLQGQP